jgi:hypothetical protein
LAAKRKKKNTAGSKYTRSSHDSRVKDNTATCQVKVLASVSNLRISIVQRYSAIKANPVFTTTAVALQWATKQKTACE